VISTRWLESHRPHWIRLEHLVERAARRGLASLARAELRELPLLYRQTAADLASIRADPASAPLAHTVQQLLARAHHLIYTRPPDSPGTALRGFARDYPSILRRNREPCLVSLSIFLVAALAGAALTYRDPVFRLQILGPRMVDTIDRREMWTHSIVAIKPIASSWIMTNNMSVALMAFASGVTGIGTAWLIAFNGLLLGVVGMACAMADMSAPLWSFVAPHAVLELPAIVVAGGAGFRLAQGVLFPGVLPRRDSIARAGSEAVRLVLGCIPALVVAGVIEAFVSPTDLAPSLKLTFAAAVFGLLVVYLFRPASAAVTGAPGA